MELLAIDTVTRALAVPVLMSFLTVILAIKYFFNKSYRVPPGPWGLPYLGYFPFLKKENLHLQLQNMQKVYGDVFSFTVTGRLFIHLGTIDAIKEAHVTKSASFQKRFKEFNMFNYIFSNAVVSQNGEAWKELRKFFNKLFKVWGMIPLKEPAIENVNEALAEIVKELNKSSGTSIDVGDLLTAKWADAMHDILFKGEKLPDEEIARNSAAFKEVMTLFLGRNQLLIGNVAKHFIYPFTWNYKCGIESFKFMVKTLTAVVKRQEATLDENKERNLIDGFLIERNIRRKRGDPSAKYFTVDCLAYTLIQFTGDGVVDVASFICKFIRYLLDYPDEQEKIYEELITVIGIVRDPNLEDKTLLPYTNAFISEVTRISDFFPLFPSVECTEETTISGYRIPKGAITLMNMWAAQHDPQTFEDPEVFNPSRYVPQAGKRKAEQAVIFGKGKRSCPGEAFIMNVVFLFVIKLVYNFKLTPGTGNDSENKGLNVVFHTRTKKLPSLEDQENA